MSEELRKEGRHGGETIDGLMTRAEKAGDKAVELLDEALLVLEEGEPEDAQNLFLTAANLYLEANNCYVQASRVDHANSRALAHLAGEMFISSQRANQTALGIYQRNNREQLEIVGRVPNAYADTWRRPEDNEPEEIEVWNVVSPAVATQEEEVAELPDVEFEPAFSDLAMALGFNKQAVTAFSEGKLSKSADFLESTATHLARGGEKELAKSVFGIAVDLRDVARDMRASSGGLLTKSVDDVRSAYAEISLAFYNTQTELLALGLNKTAEINEEIES